MTELDFCKTLFYTLGKTQARKLIQDSNLDERECLLIEYRLILGKSLKEVSDLLGIQEDSVNKSQNKTCKKLHIWISNRVKSEEIMLLFS